MANMTDTNRLNKIIDDSGLKRKWLAEQLDLSPYGFAKKINNENEFKQSEIQMLCEILKIGSLKKRQEIFFSDKVEQ